MKPHAPADAIRTARRSVDHVEAEGASILYGRLRDILRADDLAEASRDDEGTLSKMASGGGLVRFRLSTLVALCKLDPDGGRMILDLIGRELGLRWTDEPAASRGESDAIDGAWLTVEDAAQLQQTIARAARDGRFDATERQDARHRLARMEHRCKAMHAQLDALEPAPVVVDIQRKAASR